jgi:hypothetical protein
MTSVVQSQRGSANGGYLSRPSPSSLADVVALILDKGLVIDAYVRVSLVGIELLTIDARIVIASVDTYLRFAEATNRLDLYEHGGKGLTDLAGGGAEGGARRRTRGALTEAKDRFSELLHGRDDEDDDEDEEYEDDDQEYEDEDEDYEEEPEEEPVRARKSSGSRRGGRR